MSLFNTVGAVGTALVASLAATSLASAQQPVFSGPTPYTSFSNSPFFGTGMTVGVDYYLEDFEKGVIVAPGLSVSDPSTTISGPSATTDSVDLDDCRLDALGSAGSSLRNQTTGTVNLAFDDGVLGQFPTKVGLVFTDGTPASAVTLTVVSGTGTPAFHTFFPLGDGSAAGTTAEDSFLGVEWDEGIALVQVAGGGGSIEIDHVQYNAPTAGALWVRDYMNGDPRSDLNWHDPANGNVDVWFMNGLTRGGGLASQTTPTTWVAQGMGDLDDDGDADIVYRDTGTNLFHVWLMNGQTVSQSSAVAGAAAVGSAWTCIAVVDTNADRKADLVFRNSSTNALSIWYMDGITRLSTGSVTDLNSVAMSSAGLTYLASGDFNGDGRYDLLWRKTSDNSIIGWLLNGRTVFVNCSVGNSNPIGTQWIVGTSGDLDGDGRSDLAWRNTTTGVVNSWLMDGVYKKTGGVTSPIPLAWTMKASADVNGDGKFDIIWLNTTTKQVNGWLMDGIVKTSGGSITTLTSPTYTIINR